MTSVGGEILRNKLTQDLLKIKKIEGERMVMLEDEKGYVRIWLPKKHLGFFFEEVNLVRKERAFPPLKEELTLSIATTPGINAKTF
jgi:hypothetical protein